MTRLHWLHSDLVQSRMDRKLVRCSNVSRLEQLRSIIQKYGPHLKKETLDEHCETHLYTLKFHLLYHVLEDLEQLGYFGTFNAFLFEIFNGHVKHAYRTTSEMRKLGTVETVSVMDLRREENLRRMKSDDIIDCFAGVDNWTQISQTGR